MNQRRKPRSTEVKPRSTEVKPRSTEVKPRSIEVKPRSTEVKPVSGGGIRKFRNFDQKYFCIEMVFG